MSASAEKYDVYASAEPCAPVEAARRGYVTAELRISAATDKLVSVLYAAPEDLRASAVTRLRNHGSPENSSANT
jgi:hypothetical protein